ncbi:MAG: transporter substrate-binding domain-containing protein [Pseudomonadota bacterium]
MTCSVWVMEPQPAVAQKLFIPNYWDENERFAKPDLSRLPRLRFLTTTDFPPFNFIDRKKRLTGFHIDLARAICAELEVLSRCEIQALPWEELEKALEDGKGEALIAGHQVNAATRNSFDFSRPYLRIPGRFVVLKESGLQAPAYDALFRKNIAVLANSAHAKYFAEIFPTRTAKEFEARAAALDALVKKEVDAVFSDALSLSFWLTSAASKNCCRFLDSAFESVSHFGPGLSVALPKNRPELAKAMNYALNEINRKGTFAELYLRYFPVGLY